MDKEVENKKLLTLFKERASLQKSSLTASSYLVYARAEKATAEKAESLVTNMSFKMQAFRKNLDLGNNQEAMNRVVADYKSALEGSNTWRAVIDTGLESDMLSNQKSIQEMEKEAIELKQKKETTQKTPDYVANKSKAENLKVQLAMSKDEDKAELQDQINQIYNKEPLLQIENKLSEIKGSKKALRKNSRDIKLEQAKNRIAQVKDRADIVTDTVGQLRKLSPFQKFIAPILNRFGVDKKIENIIKSFEDQAVTPAQGNTLLLEEKLDQAIYDRETLEQDKANKTQEITDRKDAIVQGVTETKDGVVQVAKDIGTATTEVGRGLGITVGEKTGKLFKYVKSTFSKDNAINVLSSLREKGRNEAENSRNKFESEIESVLGSGTKEPIQPDKDLATERV